MKLIYQTTLAATAILLIACSGADAPQINTAKVTQTANQASSKAGEMSSAVKASDYTASDTKTKAVLVYADWCSSCKIIGPKIETVQTSLGAGGTIAGLEFVTLDYTDKNLENFYAQADAAGVGEAVRGYGNGNVTTGVLLLVDVDDQKVIRRVTKDFGNLEIKSALKDAVAAS